MKNRDRDAAASAFLAIAVQLADTERIGREKATEHASTLPAEQRSVFVDAFVLGWVGDAVKRAADQIRYTTDHYLMAKTTTKRGRR